MGLFSKPRRPPDNPDAPVAKPNLPASRRFGLRIESGIIQLAIAEPIDLSRYRLTIEEFTCEAESGWMTAEGSAALIQTLKHIDDRHELKGAPIAVSLDGDFCVTRISIGSKEAVAAELAALGDRIPRYLQLGPGEKVTDSARETLTDGQEYVVTGVASRNLISALYEAFRESDLKVQWLEPSLISVARLAGNDTSLSDQPILIADGTGVRWDVGIAHHGRLLLDYRPANARDGGSLRETLDGHIVRLKRFCHRQRKISSRELNRLLLCGDRETTDRALAAFSDDHLIRVDVMKVPPIENLYEIDDHDRATGNVTAVATVLPLLLDVAHDEVVDLLHDIRRAPDQSLMGRIIRIGWPAIAACLFVLISHGLAAHQRNRHGTVGNTRVELESRLAATRVKFESMTVQRKLLNELQRVQRLSPSTDSRRLFDEVTQSLPESAKLSEFRVTQSGEVILNGTTIDESIVYEIVGNLRRLPAVRGVALKGTAPETDQRSTRFLIHLTTSETKS